jgi:hypothetical protein
MKVFASKKIWWMQQKKVHEKPCGFYRLYSSNELINCKAMKDSSI